MCQKIVKKILMKDPIIEPELKSLFLGDLVENVSSYEILGLENNKLRAYILKLLSRTFQDNQD